MTERGNLIGLVGPAGAGKDTLAGYLRVFGYSRIAFADNLKRMALRLNPCVHDPVLGITDLDRIVKTEDWEKAKRYTEVRQYLQNLGVAARDIIGPNVWVDAATRGVSDRLDAGRSIVVTDVRFPNEVSRIRELGGVLCKVTRPGVVRVNNHVSESLAWDPGLEWEYEVVNASTQAALAKKAKRLADAVANGDHRRLPAVQ